MTWINDNLATQQKDTKKIKLIDFLYLFMVMRYKTPTIN